MMFASINIMSATADSTVISLSDSIPALSKREIRRQRVAKRNQIGRASCRERV